MKKGFTLIELLSVIVILAIIAIIAIPIITNVIENSKKGAFKSSLMGIIEEANLYEIKYKEKIPIEGININNDKIKIKNKLFKAGKIYIKNKKIYLDKISDNNYCGSGTIDNLIIRKGNCDDLDDVNPEISLNVNEKKVDFTLNDDYRLKSYQIIKENETSNVWNSISGIEYSFSKTFDEAGTYYIYVKDAGNNIVNESFILDKEFFCKENWCEWLELAEIKKSDYDSIDDILENNETINKLTNNQESMNYLLDTKSLIDDIKKSSKYSDDVVQYFLDSSVITNAQKYNAGLPCYIYKTAIGDFSWSQYTTMHVNWCDDYASSCREGAVGTNGSLSVYDNSGIYFMGAGLLSNSVNLTNYNNLKFYYSISGTCGGLQTQYNQEAGFFVIDNNNIWSHRYQCVNSSNWIKYNITNYTGNHTIKLWGYAGGLGSYIFTYSVNNIILF